MTLFSPAEAINARTLSGPTYFRHMSVPVLSLCMIMASSAVRSETLPIRLGGLNVALSTDHTLASSDNCSALRVCTTWGNRLAAAPRRE